VSEPKHIRLVDGVPCITLTEHEHIVNQLRELLAGCQAREEHYRATLEMFLMPMPDKSTTVMDLLLAVTESAMEALALPQDNTALKDFLEDESQNYWKAVLIDELMCIGIYTKEHDKNPKKALHEVILWNQAVAIDPAVSTDAATLIKQAKREALLEAAEAMEAGAFETPYGLRRMAGEIK
jgi:hypothetical protein